jgi:cell division protein FtsL
MTYSNINKAKAQVKGWKLFKKGLLIIVATIIIISATGNIYFQYQTIKNVEKRNMELMDKVEDINSENRRLQQQIEYATSSAFKERKAREWLGMGTANDVWIDIPEINSPESLYHNAVEENKVDNVKKWLLLFTK